jgi:WD40 repeat protein
LIAIASATGAILYRFDTLKEVLKISFDEPPQIVSWSPSGNYLTVASGAQLFVLDANTGAQQYVFQGHQENIISVSWTSDGQKLASISIDQDVIHAIVWDIQTGKSVSELEFDNWATKIQWMPDDNTLAIGPMGGMIALWDTRTGNWSPLWQDEDLFGYVTNASWSSDKAKLLTGGELGKVFVWDFPSDRLLFTYKDNGGSAVDSVAWSPNNSFVAAGFRNGEIVIWNAQTGIQIRKLNRKFGGITDSVLDLVWSPTGENLISLSRYEPITIWKVQTGEEVRSTGEHTSWVLSTVWSPDATKLATGSEDGEIIIWDMATGKKLLSFYETTGWARSLAWSPDGNQLASGGDSTVTIWDALAGIKTKMLSGHTHGVTDIAWSPDGSILASSSYDGQVFLWNASTGERFRTISGTGEMFGADDIAWSPHGDLFGVSYSPQLVGLWNPQSDERILTMGGLNNIIWHPSKDIAASISERETIVLWSTSSGNEVCRIDGDTNVTDIAWSPDGHLLLASYLDNSMMVFDIQTCQQLHVLHGHDDLITTVVWSPRGDSVATTSWDGTIIIWEINAP